MICLNGFSLFTLNMLLKKGDLSFMARLVIYQYSVPEQCTFLWYHYKYTMFINKQTVWVKVNNQWNCGLQNESVLYPYKTLWLIIMQRLWDEILFKRVDVKGCDTSLGRWYMYIHNLIYWLWRQYGKFIVPRDDDYLYVFNDAEPQETVAVSGQ